MAKPTSIRLDAELIEQLDALAVTVDRPRTWLIEQAIRRYVEEEARQVQAIREAKEAYESGNDKPLVANDQVWGALETRIQAKRR
jgi:predicted transcriptional regulator